MLEKENKEKIAIDKLWEFTETYHLPLEVDKSVKDLLVSHDIYNLSGKNEITRADLDFLSRFAAHHEEVINEDPIDLIIHMSHRIRHNSNGAVTLCKVFIPFDLYREVLSERKFTLEEAPTCKIMGIVVQPSKTLESGLDLIGIGVSKFRNTSPDKLVIVGKIYTDD